MNFAYLLAKNNLIAPKTKLSLLDYMFYLDTIWLKNHEFLNFKLDFLQRIFNKSAATNIIESLIQVLLVAELYYYFSILLSIRFLNLIDYRYK